MPYIRNESGAHLPHTLMLELFLGNPRRARGLTPAAKATAVRRIVGGINAFACKFRGGTAYSLCSGTQLGPPDAAVQALGSLLAGATLGREAPLEFVSRVELADGTAEERDTLSALAGSTNEKARRMRRRLEGAIKRRQLRLLEGAMGNSLRWHLPEMAYADRCRDGSGRTLGNIVSLGIGTRPLLDSLDCGFGASFAHVFKDDIVALWTCACVALIRNDLARVRILLSLAEHLRRTFPIMLLKAGVAHPLAGRKTGAADHPRWLMMTA